jgi:SAM-dependent methyltransferase
MTCPLCGGGPIRRVVRGPKDTWSMWTCPSCRAFPIFPRGPVNHALYGEGYFEQGSFSHAGCAGYLSYDAERGGMKEDVRTLLQPFAHPGMRVLDLGCATGIALEALCDLGLAPEKMTGMDVSEYAIGRAREVLPAVRFHVADIESAALPHDIDLILLLDVIEHLFDPETFFRRVAECLAPDGCMVITTPDPESLMRKMLGARWSEFHPGEHLVFLGSAWFERVSATSGLNIRRAWHHGKHVTLRHLTERLHGIWRFLPVRKSTRRVWVNGYDQLAIVLQKGEI